MLRPVCPKLQRPVSSSQNLAWSTAWRFQCSSGFGNAPKPRFYRGFPHAREKKRIFTAFFAIFPCVLHFPWLSFWAARVFHGKTRGSELGACFDRIGV